MRLPDGLVSPRQRPAGLPSVPASSPPAPSPPSPQGRRGGGSGMYSGGRSQARGYGSGTTRPVPTRPDNVPPPPGTGEIGPSPMAKSNCRQWQILIDVGHGFQTRRPSPAPRPPVLARRTRMAPSPTPRTIRHRTPWNGTPSTRPGRTRCRSSRRGRRGEAGVGRLISRGSLTRGGDSLS